MVEPNCLTLFCPQQCDKYWAQIRHCDKLSNGKGV